MRELLFSLPGLIIVIFLFLFISIKILKEYERGVIFFLGRFQKVKGPGLIIVIPGVQSIAKVSLRTIVMDVPPQDVITRDNVSVKVNAIIYFRVIDSQKAIIQVEDYLYATSQIAQTTLRSVLGQSQLDDLLAKREEINAKLQQIIDQQTEPWGIKVSAVEVKNLDLPQDMIRAIAQQASAERTRRAKVIHAEGEFQAAQKLAEAATVLSLNPAAIQLRYLQTLTEIAGDKNSTTIFPVPIDLLEPFFKRREPGK
ncbi:MAG TPA: slipin family protein [Nitrospiria bacterium]|nr:slipin family protein [Nitrospiria bacterium]